MEVQNPPAAVLEFSRLFKTKVYPEIQRLNEYLEKLSQLKVDELKDENKKSNELVDEPEGTRKSTDHQ